MSRDRARDGSAVEIDREAGVDRVIRIRDGASELGMLRVDPGIDHRDQHLVELKA